jgi:hypothetical protein
MSFTSHIITMADQKSPRGGTAVDIEDYSVAEMSLPCPDQLLAAR